MNRLNSSNISNEGRQSNRGDYTCSSWSSGNVAGSSLEGVAVLAACFEQGKVLTQALCPWEKNYIQQRFYGHVEWQLSSSTVPRAENSHG